MAVTILDAWSGQTAGSPNAASLTISSGSDRVLVLSYFAEVGTHALTSITVGTVAPTGSLVETSPDVSNQKIWTWYWDEAAIASMTGSTVALSKTGSASKHDYDYAVYQDVTGGAEFGTSVSSSSATSITVSTTSTSTSDDMIAVFANRSSANRDITAWDNLTEEWIFRTDYCIGIADGVGGDDDVLLTGDVTAGDIFVQLIHLKSAAAGNPTMIRMMTEEYLDD